MIITIKKMKVGHVSRESVAREIVIFSYEFVDNSMFCYYYIVVMLF